jgi:hypothetical protein
MIKTHGKRFQKVTKFFSKKRIVPFGVFRREIAGNGHS